ncbi:MAG: metal-dependent transcriptional regulator [Bacilli bacterium]|jgi:Mn-dependent DtxR family transcriptional regulator|nr:metal-dependent transcriptional regulator [Bacilli bacterium]MDD3389189.1 metal-dependent transcriptional regulator [Bacilli bacterium]MDD4344970.1 metal-dependent transcriptional regulator [Bacilli bacterium]MDD4521147.1 metal-dependent transcriptional regulator [Bacilli bacterium]MDY0399914.1 metal-dependent transcriptional regulator [Bacilli bacterium]
MKIIYESGEDYLERILMLTNEHGHVRAIDLATNMNYSKPSVSRALKTLKEKGYLFVGDDGNIVLTKNGLAVANKMLERHNLIKSFLIHLGVNKDVAWEDACRIEHDLSDESFQAFKKFVDKLYID